MDRQTFALVSTFALVLWRYWLWKKSKFNAIARRQSGQVELAANQVVKQPIIAGFVCLLIVGEVLYKPPSIDPESIIAVYLGLALLALGLAVSIRDVQSFRAEWTQSIFLSSQADENPGASRDPISMQPWKPLWPMRLELVGLALLCGSVIAALTAWLFCSAHGRAVFTALEEARGSQEIS
ncbi:MAG: hypothetical protein VYC39_04440 [Myxococcota bacterium]|nr:hypothetical protein [Myxococcota bacterium]